MLGGLGIRTPTCLKYHYCTYILQELKVSSSAAAQNVLKFTDFNVNPLKCSGIRWLYLKLFNAIQI